MSVILATIPFEPLEFVRKDLVMRGRPLFDQYDLAGTLRSAGKSMVPKFAELSADRVLSNSDDSLVEYLVAEFAVESIELDVAGITVDEPSPVQVDISQDPNRVVFDRSRPYHIEGTRYSFRVPFTGDPKLFDFKPSTWTSVLPYAEVKSNHLLFEYDVTSEKAADVKRRFDSDLATTQQYVGWIHDEVEAFNATLESSARTIVENRRAKLLADRETVDQLGYPVRRREGSSDSYAVPTKRKSRPKPVLPPSRGTFAPEPALSDADYEHIIGVIEASVRMMERSPAAFAQMNEESLRDTILVTLNSHYEGNATGETFNRSGKTDILIREGDRNVFIAECKIWRGAQTFSDAVDQLLGYACWRDTKTAIVVFNRNKNLTAVLDQIPGLVESHPNYRRTKNPRGETSFMYTLHHTDDPQRELALAVLVFDVPGE